MPMCGRSTWCIFTPGNCAGIHHSVVAKHATALATRGPATMASAQQRGAELAVTYVKRAEINLDLNDIANALQDIKTAIEKDPDYARVCIHVFLLLHSFSHLTTIAQSYLIRSRIGMLTNNREDTLKDVKKVVSLHFLFCSNLHLYPSD